MFEIRFAKLAHDPSFAYLTCSLNDKWFTLRALLP